MLITRRRLLGGIASSALAAPFIGCAPRHDAPTFASDPFTLGVASGDPDASSVVLWTRLAPEPLQADGGMPAITVPVEWEVATDEGMKQIVRRGAVDARPEEAHSLHVVVDGLQPERHYWYRFLTKNAQSRVGRTRTMPAAASLPLRFRLAVGGCQRIEQGYHTAWGDIAKSDLDLVYHYGDYIYEYAIQKAVIDARMGRSVPAEVLGRIESLAEFRLRYALYKLDPDLAAAHAAHPFVHSFDDHELSNDWGGDHSGSVEMSAAAFMNLRAAAFQAFYENAPVRPSVRPFGPHIRMFRSIQAGSLLRLAVLDTRQYRSLPACGRARVQQCDERFAADRHMIGREQEAWLFNLFDRRDTSWTVLGNQVMMMRLRYKEPDQDIVDTDKWDGNAAARQRLLQAAKDRKVSGLVAVTGDIHRSFAGNLKLDYDKPNLEDLPVGVEFVATSISSAGDGKPEADVSERIRKANPHIRYYDGRRGYLLCNFNKQRCEAQFRAVDYVSKPGAPTTTITTWIADATNQGLFV